MGVPGRGRVSHGEVLPALWDGGLQCIVNGVERTGCVAPSRTGCVAPSKGCGGANPVRGAHAPRPHRVVRTESWDAFEARGGPRASGPQSTRQVAVLFASNSPCKPCFPVQLRWAGPWGGGGRTGGGSSGGPRHTL